MRTTTAFGVLALVGALCSTAPAQTGVLGVPVPGHEFDKTGQTGMTFLKIGPLAAPAAMGDAYTGLSVGAAGTFYNPGGVGFFDGRFDAVASHVRWIADIGISSAAIAVPIRVGSAGRLGVVALSLVSMDYGDIYGTVNLAGAAVYRDVGKLEPTESAVGLTLARQFTDKFSVGITAKYVSQSLPWYLTHNVNLNPNTDTTMHASASLVVLDGGTLYKTGFGSSVISMSIRNYARSQTYVIDRFLLPMTFNIGLAADAFDLAPALKRAGHKLMIAVDGSHPPDHPEKYAVGGQYSFREILFLRGGYSFRNDARKASFGAGLKLTIAGVRGAFDYAYSDFGAALGSVNYFTLSFGM